MGAGDWDRGGKFNRIAKAQELMPGKDSRGKVDGIYALVMVICWDDLLFPASFPVPYTLLSHFPSTPLLLLRRRSHSYPHHPRIPKHPPHDPQHTNNQHTRKSAGTRPHRRVRFAFLLDFGLAGTAVGLGDVVHY
jgi:hypothetical protein